MTTQTHRDLYASQLVNTGDLLLKRLQASYAMVETLPPEMRPASHTWHRPHVLKDYTDKLRVLLELARMPGKDPITVTVDDMANFVHLKDFALDLEKAIEKAKLP